MKVYADDHDTFAAPSLDALPAVFNAHYGPNAFELESSLDEWTEIDGDKPITICNVHDRGLDDKETKTAREWAEQNGAGLLCSTEW